MKQENLKSKIIEVSKEIKGISTKSIRSNLLIRSKKEQKGITLIALVITIIVLLILAGVTIATLLGDNGIITRAKEAAELTEIENEKWAITTAVSDLQMEGKELTQENLKKELDSVTGNTKTKVEDLGDGSFLVTFPSGRVYEVDKDGNITYLGKEKDLEDQIIVTVNKETDLEPKQMQEVEITAKIYTTGKDIKIQYAWSNSNDTKPSSYQDVTRLEETELKKKANVSISADDHETGTYYLWVKVTAGDNEVEETYGGYSIRKYTTLLSCSNESGQSGPEKSFLGNTKIQRGKIKTVTLTNNIGGKKAGEGNCWDVSNTGEGFILAWYGEEKVGDEIYYNVTIGAEGKIIANENSSELFSWIGSNVTSQEVQITGLENLDTSQVRNMSRLFFGCKNLVSLDVSCFDTSNVTNMNYMFGGCSKLNGLYLSNLNTSNVNNFGGMFYYCESLTSLDVSNFDTSKATSLEWMFLNCSRLAKLDVTNFDTTQVTNMGGLFLGCEQLESLDLIGFDTGNVKNMSLMFNDCTSLTDLDLSNFDTSQVTNLEGMFRVCRLESLDLRKWVINDDVNAENMFDGIDNHIVIKVSSDEIKSKLMNFYDKFTEENFQISN